jgi:hypothetical protein
LRNGADQSCAIGRVLAGVAVHAGWNASVVIAVIAGVAYDAGGASDTHAAISLAYTAAIGVLSAAALWFVTSSVMRTSTRPTSIPATGGHWLDGLF